jgi:hypothetical protein
VRQPPEAEREERKVQRGDSGRVGSPSVTATTLRISRCAALYLLRALDRPLWSVLITSFAYLLFILLRLQLTGNDPSVFILLGDHFADPSRVPPHVRVLPHSWGWDGQYYYALALDPFTSHRVVHGVELDSPAYRQQRIVYPLLVWALAHGQISLVPGLMILVNYLALLLLALVASRMAQLLGQHALWGLLLPFYPAFVNCLAVDLPEALSALFVCSGLLFLWTRRYAFSAALFSLALLTRETALIVPLAIGLTSLVVWLAPRVSARLPGRLGDRWTSATRHMAATRRLSGWRGVPWYVWGVPIAALACWETFLTVRWHAIPTLAGRGNAGLPLSGFVQFLRVITPPHTPDQWTMLWELVFVLALLLASGLTLRRARLAPDLKLAWLLYFGFTCTFSAAVWISTSGFMRTLAEDAVICVFVLLAWRTRWRLQLAAMALLTGAAWWYLAQVSLGS